jgi:aerobic C4-dicarboxylate transport protein
MSEARALTNLVGNGVATLVVAKWCGQLDEKQLHAALVQGVPMPEHDEVTFDQAMAHAGQALPQAIHEAAPGAR